MIANDLKKEARRYETASQVYNKGMYDKNFDFEEGLDKLIKKKNKYYIYTAGKMWPKFDYDKALDGLAKIKKSAYWIVQAGLFWPKFNYKKAIKIIRKKFPNFYKYALREWPKGPRQLKNINKKLSKNKEIPVKKFKLKEDIKDLAGIKSLDN